MNLRHLRYFCAAYETRSTVAAAKACHVAQPSISAAITALEEELGAHLFVRQPRGLSPTPEGIRLFKLGSRLLADAEAIKESFRPEGDATRLAVYVHPTISTRHASQWFRYLRQPLPGLEWQVVSDQENADVQLTPQSCCSPHDQFHALWEEQYALLVPKAHPLAIEPELTFSDLHGTPFIERSECELSSHWQAGLQQLQIVPDVRARVSSHEWALSLVAAGVGVTIAPLHPNDDLDGIVARTDLPEIAPLIRQVGVAFPAMLENDMRTRLEDASRSWGGPTMSGLALGAVSSVG